MELSANDLELSVEQKALYDTLHELREHAGAHEDKFTKLSIIKAAQLADYEAAVAEIKALKQAERAHTQRAGALRRAAAETKEHLDATNAALAAAARDATAVQHAITALRDSNAQLASKMSKLAHEFNARLDKERAYIAAIEDKIKRANDSQSGAELEAEQKHVSEQLASALAERREVDAAASRFAATRFGGQVPLKVATTAAALMNDSSVSTDELDARLAAVTAARA